MPAHRSCEAWLFEHGQVVFETEPLPADAFDVWVRCVAQLSGQRVDWHYDGDRAVVRAVGDLVKVHQALRSLLAVHDQLAGPDARSKLVAPDRSPHRRAPMAGLPLLTPDEDE